MKPSARLLSLLTAIVITVPPAAPALPDAAAAAGRLILRRHADAIVTVKTVASLKLVIGGRTMPPREDKAEVNGTVISPSGLTVTSLSLIDPQVIFESMRSQMAGRGTVELDQAEYKEIKLRLADGAEFAGQLVWKDSARDLALIAPLQNATQGRTFACVELVEAPDAAVLLGDYYVLSRAGEALQRTPMVQPTTIISILERPRRMFLVSTEAVGCPVFDVQGRVLGICVRLTAKGMPVGAVVVPAAEVLNAANLAVAAH
jgi:S1-C subfamily serine protease